MRIRYYGLAAVAALAMCSSIRATAQSGASAVVRLTGVSDSTPTVDPGTSFTRVYSVTNRAGDTVVVIPRISALEGWSVLIGSLPFALAPRGSDTWIVSIAVPAQAAAGRHVIRVEASSADSTIALADSIPVIVTTRRDLALTLGEIPPYVVTGSPYELSLTVRNRGNAPATVSLEATSSSGGLVTTKPATADLQPGESRKVVVQVRPRPTSIAPSPEDVVEVTAKDSHYSLVNATASTRVTVAQAPGTSEPFATVPAQLRLRGAKPDAGVAPVELIGSGPLREGQPERLDFTFRGPGNRISPFGEREEYRLDLRAPRYRVKLGDNFFAVSPLTNQGQAGFGAGVDWRLGEFSTGGYSERFRFQAGRPSESGVFASYEPSLLADSRIAFNAVQRSGEIFAGRILSTTAAFKPRADMSVETEYAGSSGSAGKGAANSLRVNGGTFLRYDAAHVWGSRAFAGPTRGSQDDYATVSAKASEEIELNATGTYHRFSFPSVLGTSRQGSRAATIGASWQGAWALEYSRLARDYKSPASLIEEREQLVRARGSTVVSGQSVWGGAEVGRSATDTATTSRTFSQLSLGSSASFGQNAFSVFVEAYSGGSVTRGPASMTIGGSGSFRVTQTTEFSMNGYRVRYASGANRTGSQIDWRLTQSLPTGASLSLRARLSTILGPGVSPQRIGYLEYGMPLHIPVGRRKSPGTVTGRIVDAESGEGVAGALVRLGSAAGITDEDGHVSFVGLPMGAYRVAVAQHGGGSDAVLSGEPNISIDSSHPRPAPFRVVVSRPASLTGTVRQKTRVSTPLDGGPDSLQDSGGLADVSIALIGQRDTLYRTTDTEGEFSFADIPGGVWTVVVMSDPPSECYYLHNTITLPLAAAQSAVADFWVLPRRREIRMLEAQSEPLEPLTRPRHDRQ
ncbi:MAG: hypothetical protein M3Z54_08790 [Gemmatimonadota bacterium]|nr:hypothetical protein [Gemmatimonadota bacterium]